MKSLINFLKNETILTAAWVLALLSAFFVPPTAAYFDYIDFRTLGILWGMMVITAGLREHGFFSLAGRKLVRGAGSLVDRETVRGAGSLASLVITLVFLCFFFSMLITNDVALLTFVPLTISILRSNGRADLMVPVIVLQTLSANLGSMLTPVGNPQNLYLYSISGISLPDFIIIMLPYTLASAALLLVSCLLTARKAGKGKANVTGNTEPCDRKAGKNTASGIPETSDTGACTMLPDNRQPGADTISTDDRKPAAVYTLLFAMALLTVVRILPWQILAAAILAVVFIMEKKVLMMADYGLLATFVGFFIFTGNMGNLPALADLLAGLVQGHETILGILVSQVISNVPAALLLSGFTDNYPALIIGVNLGGLGTLIASMASLISYKFAVSAEPDGKKEYFLKFTAANVIYLVILAAMWLVI